MFDLIPFGRRDKDLFHYFDDFNKNFFGDMGIAEFKTDIMDKGDKYILQAELPGFAKEDIQIDINGDYLTISAEHKEEKEEKKDDYIRKERRYGSFARSFNIADVKADAISAEYKDGVLELEMPKCTPEAAKTQKVLIK